MESRSARDHLADAMASMTPEEIREMALSLADLVESLDQALEAFDVAARRLHSANASAMSLSRAVTASYAQAARLCKHRSTRGEGLAMLKELSAAPLVFAPIPKIPDRKPLDFATIFLVENNRWPQ